MAGQRDGDPEGIIQMKLDKAKIMEAETNLNQVLKELVLLTTD